MPKSIVSDFMSTEPIAARADMPLTDLVALLAQHSVRGVPVIGPSNRLEGVVTETDLFLRDRGIPFSIERAPALLGEFIDPKSVEDFAACRSVTVGEVMTTAPVTIEPTASLWSAAQLMSERRLSLLPVVENDEWIGTVRRIAILKKIYH